MRDALLGLLVISLPMLAGVLFYGFRRLGVYLDNRQGLTGIAAVGARVGKLALNIVADLEATLRPVLKDVTSDGKLTLEEARRIKGTALNDLKRALGAEGLEQVVQVIGIERPAIDQYLSGEIETAHKQVKALNAKSSVPGPSLPK